MNSRIFITFSDSTFRFYLILRILLPFAHRFNCQVVYFVEHLSIRENLEKKNLWKFGFKQTSQNSTRKKCVILRKRTCLLFLSWNDALLSLRVEFWEVWFQIVKIMILKIVKNDHFNLRKYQRKLTARMRASKLLSCLRDLLETSFFLQVGHSLFPRLNAAVIHSSQNRCRHSSNS